MAGDEGGGDEQMIVEDECAAGQQRFHRYEILRKLGRGMADVYLAHDPRLNRQVVLKIIEKSSSESTRMAIEAERRGALLQQQLHAVDGRILAIYEMGEQGGCFFLAMEYFPGRTLASVIGGEQRLEAKRAARYGAQVCELLRTLHNFASGDSIKTAIVHGDIKPSNIQIGANDEVRLLDFGIAKLITPGHDLTHHQLGSPSYCSPERLRESQISLQSDLWAVGVTLYEMLAGVPPFQAQSTRKLESLIQSRRPPEQLPATCPPRLKEIVAKALAPQVKQRYVSAEAMQADLQSFAEGRVAPAIPSHGAGNYAKANTTIFRLRWKAEPKVKARAAVQKHRKSRQDRANVAIALLAGILAGLLLFVPLTYYFKLRELSRTLTVRKDYVQLDASAIESDWELYQMFKRGHSWWSGLFSIEELEGPLHRNLVESADNLISRFRRSSGQELNATEWNRARLCLLKALAMDVNDARARGELHLCDGYLNLVHGRENGTIATSLKEFRRAEALLPRSPDPALGLARAYIYGLHNVGAALAAFQGARQLGYGLGPRELEQQGDGYFFRGHANLSRAKREADAARLEIGTGRDQAKWLRMARADLERSRGIYEPISGFDRVDTSLEKIEADLKQTEELQANLLRPGAEASTRPVVFRSPKKAARSSKRPKYPDNASRMAAMIVRIATAATAPR